MVGFLLVMIYGYLLGTQSQYLFLKYLGEGHFDWLRWYNLFQLSSRNPYFIRAQRRSIFLALVFAWVWFYFSSWLALSLTTFLVLLYTAAKIDFRSGMIPDSVTLLGIFLGLIFSMTCPINPPALLGNIENFHFALFLSGIIGLLIVSGVLLWVAIFFELLTGNEGLGFGDIKLAGMLGAFLGWEGGLRSLFYGAWVAILLEMGRLLFVQRISPQRRIPFAPYMALGTAIYLFRVMF